MLLMSPASTLAMALFRMVRGRLFLDAGRIARLSLRLLLMVGCLGELCACRGMAVRTSVLTIGASDASRVGVHLGCGAAKPHLVSRTPRVAHAPGDAFHTLPMRSDSAS